MTKKIGLLAIGLGVAMGVLLLPGCLKDKVVKSYRIYTPVYTQKATVLASLNGNPSQAIAKPGNIYVKGSFIYISDANSGIHIIDNSNPAQPVQTAFLSIPGNQNIAIRGNILYADMYNDLLAINISNPKQARIIDTLANVFPYRYYGQGGSNTVITGWTIKDTSMVSSTAASQQLYNVSGNIYTMNQSLVPAAFAAANSAQTTGTAGSEAAMTLIGDYLYLIPEPHSLDVVNITDSSHLTVSNNPMAGYDMETIFPVRNRLLVGSKEGVYVFSIDNPAQPTKLGEFKHGTSCDPVIADSNYAYVTLRSGTYCGGASNELDVLNAQDLSQVSLLKTYSMTSPGGLGKDGSLLFVCDAPVVKVFNAADPSNLQPLTTLPVSNAYDLIAANHLLMVISAGGLDQFDYSDPNHIVTLSHLSINLSQK